MARTAESCTFFPLFLFLYLVGLTCWGCVIVCLGNERGVRRVVNTVKSEANSWTSSQPVPARSAAGEWLYSPQERRPLEGREFLGILQFPEDSTSTTFLSGTFLEFNSCHKNTIMRTPVSMLHYLKAWIKLAALTQSAVQDVLHDFLSSMDCFSVNWWTMHGSDWCSSTFCSMSTHFCEHKGKKSWTE